jgi:hypothetical protein
MSREAKAALGFRMKSGFAVAVLVAGSPQAPEALSRIIVELSDAGVPESKQPYHAAMGVLEEDEDTIWQRTQVVERVAKRSVAVLLDDFREGAHRICGAGLVVGSLIDPDSISNPHIRAHALEGRLFRQILQRALEAKSLSCSVFVERDIYRMAAALLALPEVELKRALAGLGPSLGGPWRAEEKLAALAAWMTLATPGVARVE